jgi:hypothetical protein
MICDMVLYDVAIAKTAIDLGSETGPLRILDTMHWLQEARAFHTYKPCLRYDGRSFVAVSVGIALTA